jgi:hypothetical protein
VIVEQALTKLTNILAFSYMLKCSTCHKKRMILLKNIIVVSIFIIISVLTGCSGQDTQHEVTKKDENSYTVSVPLNFEVMEEYYEKDVQKGIESQFANLDYLEADKTRVELEFDVIGEKASVKGTIFFKEGSYSFNGEGIFVEFTSPDTENIYYYGDIESDVGFNFITMFSLEDKRAYVETPVPVEIGEYKYHAIFGEKFVNKEYWDALYSQIP